MRCHRAHRGNHKAGRRNRIRSSMHHCQLPDFRHHSQLRAGPFPLGFLHNQAKVQCTCNWPTRDPGLWMDRHHHMDFPEGHYRLDLPCNRSIPHCTYNSSTTGRCRWLGRHHRTPFRARQIHWACLRSPRLLPCNRNSHPRSPRWSAGFRHRRGRREVHPRQVRLSNPPGGRCTGNPWSKCRPL